jgi:hypothetical protein
VMERDVLFDTRCRLELRIAGRACLCHRVMNSRDAILKMLLSITQASMVSSNNRGGVLINPQSNPWRSTLIEYLLTVDPNRTRVTVRESS